MSSHRLLLALCSLALLLATVTGQCSKQEINNASKEFKDCVDEKEKSILHNDSHEQEFICSVLEKLKEECSRKLAKCRSREYVDDKVALHIDSISVILSSLYSDVSLKTCSVMITPSPPTIVQQDGAGDAKPAYEPVTSSANPGSASSLLTALLGLTMWARIAK